MASGTHKEEEYFPVKLYRMVEDEAFNEIIWWNEVCRIRKLKLIKLEIFFLRLSIWTMPLRYNECVYLFSRPVTSDVPDVPTMNQQHESYREF